MGAIVQLVNALLLSLKKRTASVQVNLAPQALGRLHLTRTNSAAELT